MKCKYCGAPLKNSRSFCCWSIECTKLYYRDRRGYKPTFKVHCSSCNKEIRVRKEEGLHYCVKCRVHKNFKTSGELAYQVEYNRKWDLPMPKNGEVERAEKLGSKLRVTIYDRWSNEAIDAGKKMSKFIDNLYAEREVEYSDQA